MLILKHGRILQNVKNQRVAQSRFSKSCLPCLTLETQLLQMHRNLTSLIQMATSNKQRRSLYQIQVIWLDKLSLLILMKSMMIKLKLSDHRLIQVSYLKPHWEMHHQLYYYSVNGFLESSNTMTSTKQPKQREQFNLKWNQRREFLAAVWLEEEILLKSSMNKFLD